MDVTRFKREVADLADKIMNNGPLAPCGSQDDDPTPHGDLDKLVEDSPERLDEWLEKQWPTG